MLCLYVLSYYLQHEPRSFRKRGERGGGSLGSIVGRSGGEPKSCYSCFMWMYLNAPAVSLVFQVFDDTGSLGSSSRLVLYPSCSIVPPWVPDSRFHFFFTPTFLFSPVFPLLWQFHLNFPHPHIHLFHYFIHIPIEKAKGTWHNLVSNYFHL